MNYPAGVTDAAFDEPERSNAEQEYAVHEKKVLAADTPEKMEVAIRNLDEAMEKYFHGKNSILNYMMIIACMHEGEGYSDYVGDYLYFWKRKIDDMKEGW